MAATIVFAVSIILSLLSATTAQTPPSPFLPPVPAPAPAPAPDFVNISYLLSVAGPFHTFLNYLIQTQVLDTFQNQANNTEQGITIFVPKDSAFSAFKKPVLANLTQEQLKSLTLFHAIPKFYTLSDFKNLSTFNPVSTFAGGQYTVNVTDASGLIRVGSSWSDPKIISSVYSSYPAAIYEVNQVLLPSAIFTSDPPLAPAPAPAPEVTPVSDLAPSLSGSGSAPKSSESSTSNAASYTISVGVMSYLAVAASGSLMLLL